MNIMLKHLFPFLDSKDFMENKFYLTIFSATLFLLSSLFSYQLFILYSPELYSGVNQVFPISLLGIFILIFITTTYFIFFILTPFTLKFLFFNEQPVFEIKRLVLPISDTKFKKEIFTITTKFKGPLSTIIRC